MRLALLQQEEKEEVKARKIITLTSPVMRGYDIKALQTALNALGYDAGDADGIAGKNTVAAIQRFAGDYANAGGYSAFYLLFSIYLVDKPLKCGIIKIQFRTIGNIYDLAAYFT